jgi:hypothetical protein
MAQLLAAGTAAADSADIVVAAGTPATVFIGSAVTDTPPDSGAVYALKIKSTGGVYTQIGQLDCASPQRSINTPGTYRISRIATGASSSLEQG